MSKQSHIITSSTHHKFHNSRINFIFIFIPLELQLTVTIVFHSQDISNVMAHYVSQLHCVPQKNMWLHFLQ